MLSRRFRDAINPWTAGPQKHMPCAHRPRRAGLASARDCAKIGYALGSPKTQKKRTNGSILPAVAPCILALAALAYSGADSSRNPEAGRSLWQRRSRISVGAE